MPSILSKLSLESVTTPIYLALQLAGTILLVAIAAVLIVGPAAAECIDYGEYMHWVGTVETPTYAVSVTTEGNYMYLTGGFGLLVMDISAPEDPVTVGGVGTIGFAEDVTVSGSYAYVLGAGLYVIDISDPMNPVIVGSVDAGFSFPTSVVVAGDYAYATASSGLSVIDISDPSSPVVVGNLDTPGQAGGLALKESHAYVADASSGLQVIDVSDPFNPVIVGNVPMTWAGLVEISDQYAYALDQDGLYVVDISIPHAPAVVAIAEVGVPGGCLDIVGDYAYVGGLSVVDISDPANPEEVGMLKAGFDFGVAVSAGYAYGVPGVNIVDVTNPETPEIVGSVDTSGGAQSTVVDGSYAYVASSYAGLEVVDISTPQTPVLVATLDTPGYACDVFLMGSHIYLADESEGLQVIDINDPMNPLIAGHADTDQAIGVAVVGSYAYVADGQSGLQIIDISDPPNPTILGEVDTGFGYDVDVSGCCAYVVGQFPGVSTKGLSVVDVTDPVNPLVVGTVETPGSAIGVEVSGSYAYVADTDGGLQIVDVTVPTLPVIAGSAEARSAVDVVVSENWVYVGHPRGVLVFSLLDPVNPKIVGGIDKFGPTEQLSVFLDGGYAYVADGLGLKILPLQCQTVATALQASSSRWTGRHVEVTWQLVGIAGELTFEIARRENGTGDFVMVADPTVSSRGDGEFVFSDHSTQPGTTYDYRVGILENGEPVTAFETTVTTPPALLTLEQNHPNPFNPVTNIEFSLDSEMAVQLNVYDVEGRLVATLIDRRMTVGEHVVEWNGQDDRGERVASGVYLYRLTAGKRTLTRKAVVLK